MADIIIAIVELGAAHQQILAGLPLTWGKQPYLDILVWLEEPQEIHVCLLLGEVQLLAHENCLGALSWRRGL